MKIHMILLAAGNSRRFGKNKLLSAFNGKPMYLHLADRLEQIAIEETGLKIVVSQYQEILETMAERNYLPVCNANPEPGISSSIKLGVQALIEKGIGQDDAVCFFVCDQPYLRKNTIEDFLIEYTQSGKGISCVGHGEMMGNPVIFHVSYLNELLALSGDVGGKRVLKNHLEDVSIFPVEERELEDIDYRKKSLVAVRGGGDLASGTIYRLHREGYRVLVLETGKPACIRRQVSFSEAVYDGEAAVEGVQSVLIHEAKECEAVWADGKIPVIVDSKGDSVVKLKPQVVVDAIIAKKNLGTNKGMAPLTIALGPGFEAGQDVDAVIETMRGETLGKIYREGSAIPNTGVPGMIGGYAKERVIHAPADGKLKSVKQVGDTVTKGEVIAYVGETPVHASLTGILRGLIREGFEVKKGLKIIDIDPRINELENCFHISDKAKKIAQSVFEVIKSWEEEQQPLYERIQLDLESQRVISFVGAGGKTTLAYRLAGELAALGNKVIVTTTTHMERPAEHFCEWGEKISLNKGEFLTVGVSCENGKIKGMEENAYARLLECADFLLIEADGSKRMPLKVPAEHEPVLLKETNLVVGVLGYNSVGKKISEVSHRPQDVADFLGKQLSDPVTVQDLEKISFSEKGLMKGIHVPYRVVWNQWREQEDNNYESSNNNRKYIRIQGV